MSKHRARVDGNVDRPPVEHRVEERARRGSGRRRLLVLGALGLAVVLLLAGGGAWWLTER